MAASDSKIWRWFYATFTEPTSVQAAAWPAIAAGGNTLIVSPTGTGKTLAAFLIVLDELDRAIEKPEFQEGIYALYISPLRALSYDLEKNLRGPLDAIFGKDPPIRIGLRSGDTAVEERHRQFTQPPHILLTTPESLCLLLSQPKWLPHLAKVRWAIVDEVHALAENKRGAHLTLSLERLEAVRAEAGEAQPLQRIGLSATVAPLVEAGSFLSGAGRACQIVDVSSAKKIDLRVYSPLQKNPYPPSGYTGVRLVAELGRLIRKYRTTLVFTNTRSGAESATYWLRERMPDLAGQIECHHASLDRDVRLEVEDRLKRGELRAVVCSTSLELGVDIGSVDLVVMLSTPKGVSRALQRTGRAGHNIREVSRGLLMATNLQDLIECCATARLARAGRLDLLRIPSAPLDVLAQHLMGMGCIREWRLDEAYERVTQAWPYRHLPRRDFEDVVDYLAGGGHALRKQYSEVFGRIQVVDDHFEARPGSVRRDFLQNVGTIPAEGVIRVFLRSQSLGTVEESFVRQLQIGDVFTLGGRPVKVERIGGMECWVTRADGQTPTVPRWNATKFPLANRVAAEISAFRSEIRKTLEEGEPAGKTIEWIAERLECGAANALIIYRVHATQNAASEIPTADFLLVEEFQDGSEPASIPGTAPKPERRRRGGSARAVEARPPAAVFGSSRQFFFHCLIGRAANDALSRVVALRMARRGAGNSVATADDYGFVLTCDQTARLDEKVLASLFSPAEFQADLDAAIDRSTLLKYHFRNAAQTGLMVYRNYFGEQKSARKMQWSAEVIFNVLIQHEPQHVLLREARRDAAHSFLDGARALDFLQTMQERKLPIRTRKVAVVPPLSFAMYATKIKEALLVEDPRETLEKIYHHWWARLGGDEPEEAGAR